MRQEVFNTDNLYYFRLAANIGKYFMKKIRSEVRIEKGLEIDWRDIPDQNSFYDQVLTRLAVPSWHGRNLDALWDSITGNDLNEFRAPFFVHELNTDQIPEELNAFAKEVRRIFTSDEAKAVGVEYIFL